MIRRRTRTAPSSTVSSTVRSSVAMASAVALLAGVAAPAQAQSSQVLGSIADATPQSLVDKGSAPHPLPAYDGSPVDSGLIVGEPPAETGQAMAEVPLDPSVGLSGAAVQKRFSYSTVDQHGQPSTATAALFLPPGKAPEGGFPVVAWAHGTVGLADHCAPSMNPRSERDTKYLNHWLSQGYAIVASDYAGLGAPGLHSYLNGQVTASNVVDSVIAAQQLEDGPQLSKKWAVVGQSQGGGAALHVAHRATQLSTDAGLDFRGTVATGAPAFIEETVLGAGPTFPPVPLPEGMSVYSMYILAAFQEAHPEVDVDSALTDEGRQMVEAAKNSCYEQMAAVMDGVNVSRAFTKPLRDVPGLEKALRSFMETQTTGYDKPVFFGHGLKDIDVPTPIGVVLNSEMWLNQFIADANARNNRVEVRWYPTDHSGTVMRSTVDSTPFLRSLFR